MIAVPRIPLIVIIMVSKALNGFTLIELLVSIAIIMVITGGVMVNYNTYNDAQKVRQAALTVRNNLRYAQSRAYNGEKPSLGCTILAGYLVIFTVNSYSTQAACSEGVTGEAQTVVLETGVSFSPVPSDILFRVLTRGIDSDMTVKVTGSSRSYQFQVTRSGDMSDVTQVP